MPDHLKHSASTGHLLHNTVGHLINECGGGVAQEGWYPRLINDVDGLPAITFGDSRYNNIGFIIRATGVDSAGAPTGWGTAVEIFVDGTYNGGLEGINLNGVGSFITALGAFTHTARLGTDSTVTNPLRLFVAEIRDTGNGNLFMLADNDQATTFTETVFTGQAGHANSSALLLPNEHPAVFWYYNFGNSYAQIGDDVDGSSFTQYTLGNLRPLIARNIDGRPAVINEAGVYQRSDNAGGTSWTNSLTSSLGTVVYDMRDVGGVPAILIQDTNSPYYLAIAFGNDADVSTGFGTPIQIPIYDPYGYWNYPRNDNTSNGCGTPLGATLEVDPDDYNNLTVWWSISDPVPILGDLIGSYYYYYYEVLGYNIVVFKSTSTDGGATWATATQEFTKTVDTSANQYFTCFDNDEGNISYMYFGDGGISVEPILRYNGEDIII